MRLSGRSYSLCALAVFMLSAAICAALPATVLGQENDDGLPSGVAGTGTAEVGKGSTPFSVNISTCVDAAMERNPNIRQAREGVDASEAAVKSVRGGFGPSVTLDANITRWDEPTMRSFSTGGDATVPTLPPPTTVYEMIIYEQAQRTGQATLIQEQVTWSVAGTISMPLTPLYAVYKGYRLAEMGVDIARLKEQETRNAVTLAVLDAYYGFLQSKAVWQAVQASIKRVEAALAQMIRLKEAKVVGKGDVLKMQVALAAVKQSEVQTRNTMEILRANLATQVGWGVEVEVEPEDVPKALPSPPGEDIEAALLRAVQQRVELKGLRSQLGQTELSEDQVKSDFIPQVVAFGTVSHAEGNTFRKEDSWYIGLNLSWRLFEWGRTYYRLDEARARTRQISAALDAATRLVQLEVKRAWLDLESARENLDAAQARIDEAQENYRVQLSLYEAQYKTSTDLIDAEASLTDATAQQAVAFYRVWQAYAALKRAMGAPTSDWFASALPNAGRELSGLRLNQDEVSKQGEGEAPISRRRGGTEDQVVRWTK